MEHDRCNYVIPGTIWMMEMPINGGQYHQTIASLWISHLVDYIPLTPVLTAHIASAQITNHHKMTNPFGMLLSLYSFSHHLHSS